MISVLLPTRGRPEGLKQAVESIYLTSKYKDVEFLLRVDADDGETIRIGKGLIGDYNGKIFIAPRGRGYRDINIWINDLAKEARGEWLFLFNDDAKMLTPHWDEILRTSLPHQPWCGNPDILLLCAQTLGRPGCSEFPFLRRKVVEICGHFSESIHNDNWAWSVLNMVRSAFYAPIWVEHLSAEMNDEVRKGSVEAYKTSIYTLITPEAMGAQLRDARLLLDYIVKHTMHGPGVF